MSHDNSKSIISSQELPIFSPEAVIALAGKLKIMDREATSMRNVVLHQEQMALIRAIAYNKKTLILKGRQVGITTACTLAIVVMALMYERTNSCCVANVHGNTQAIMDKVESFCEQLNVLKKSAHGKIRLKNGSTIVGLSAQGSTGIRSRSFQFLHFSELDFYGSRDVYSQLLQAASLSARVLAESTAARPDGLMQSLWASENDYRKLFFSVEDHRLHRSDAPITEEQWQEAQTWGFTDRRAASWFHHKLRTEFYDELIPCLREFPQLDSHPFGTREGRWILTTHPVVPHTDWQGFKVFKEPSPSRRYYVGVDPSTGVGACNASVVVLDRSSGELCASFASNKFEPDQLVDKIELAHTKYHSDNVYIEANGIGSTTVYLSLQRKLPVIQVHTNEQSCYAGLLEVKRQIQSGQIRGGDDLMKEVQSLSLVDNGSRRYFTGNKDLLMALSLVAPEIAKYPWVAPKSELDARVYVMPARRKSAVF